MLLALLIFAAAPPTTQPSVERLARLVVEQSAHATPEAPVAVYVEAPTPALARAFASVLASLLASQRLSPVVLEARNAAAAEQLARDKDLRTLVRLTLTLEAARLVARGDLLHTWVNFWAGTTTTRMGPATALAAAVDADLQASTLGSFTGGSTTKVSLTLTVLARLSAAPVAIAIGELGTDPQPKIAVLTERDVQVFSADGKPIARYDLSGLPPATQPTREPFGAVVVQDGKVVWLSGRRAQGETLAFIGGTLKSLGLANEVTLAGVRVHLGNGLNAFAADAASLGSSPPKPFSLTASNSRLGLNLFLFANGTGAVTPGIPPTTVFSRAPSAAVLADLDGDGFAELVSTSARFFPEADEVKVLAAASAEALTRRSGSLDELPVVWAGQILRGRLLSAAAGDLDHNGDDEVVFGAWLADGSGELILARRSAP